MTEDELKQLKTEFIAAYRINNSIEDSRARVGVGDHQFRQIRRDDEVFDRLVKKLSAKFSKARRQHMFNLERCKSRYV